MDSLTRGELLARPLTQKNLTALAASGQTTALVWLQQAPVSEQVQQSVDQYGRPLIVVGGQSQSSRRDPAREAQSWLDSLRRQQNLDAAESLTLFGFGNPWLVLELLRENKPVAVYEPNPLVVLAALSQHEFSGFFLNAKARLSLLTPWHLAQAELSELSRSTVLRHPPALRRAPAQAAALARLWRGRSLKAQAGRKLKIMLIPPLSGGPLPMAQALARAVERQGHSLAYLAWGEELQALELSAHRAQGSETASLTARLFELCARLALSRAAEFQPDLILALAQAPLEARALERLKETCGALLAFWLVEDFRYFRYAEQVAPAYDAFFHIQAGLIEGALKNWGLNRAFYLPAAADPNLFKPLAEKSSAAEAYRAALSFMGAPYPNRRRLMERLAAEFWPQTGRPAAQFRLFGSGWEEAASPELQKHLFAKGRRVSEPECALIYAGGLINLNIHSSFQAEPLFDPSSAFVNPRTFEIAAAGRLQIVDQRPLLDGLFEAGRHLVVVRDYEELSGAIDYYLAQPERAALLGEAARQQVLAKHSYEHRLRQMLAYLGWSPAAEAAL